MSQCAGVTCSSLHPGEKRSRQRASDGTCQVSDEDLTERMFVDLNKSCGLESALSHMTCDVTSCMCLTDLTVRLIRKETLTHWRDFIVKQTGSDAFAATGNYKRNQ